MRALPWDKATIGYLAGIIDGEGSIYVVKQRGALFPALAVTVTSCDIELIEWLRDHVGGYLYSRPHQTKNPRWRDSHVWIVKTAVAANLLETVLPYLQIKSKRLKAEAGITYARSARSGRSTASYRALRTNLLSRFREIKTRGI